MAYGIEIYNDSGQIQIDQDYFNLSLKSKSALSSLSAASFGGTYLGQPTYSKSAVFWVIDYTGTTPVVAVKPPDGRSIFVSHLYDENTTGSPPTAGTRRLVFWSPGTTAATLTWYLFDRVDTTGILDTGYGIQVKNASGQVVYHSAKPVMRIRQLVTLSGANVEAGTSYSKSSSLLYAYVFGNAEKGRYYPTQASGTRFMKSVGFSPTSTSVSLVGGDAMEPYGGIGSGSLIDYPAPGFMLDVTYL